MDDVIVICAGDIWELKICPHTNKFTNKSLNQFPGVFTKSEIAFTWIQRGFIYYSIGLIPRNNYGK